MTNGIGAIDWGYSYVKQIYNGERRLYPSLVGNGYEKSFSLGNRPPIEEMVVETDKMYFVGENARRNSNMFYSSVKQERFDDPAFDALMKASLGLMGWGNSLKIVTGLPPKFYATHKGIIIDTLKGLHKFEFNGKPVMVNVTDVQVLPQLVGTALDLMYDDQGHLKPTQLFNKTFGIIDPGFGTTDYAIIAKGEYRDDMKDSTRYNMNEVYRLVGRELFNQYRIEVNEVLLDEVIRSRRIEISGDTFDITPVVDWAMDTVAKAIATHAESIWLQKWDINKIFLTGGGGEALYPYIKKYINVEKVEDAQWSNVRGYYKKALRAWA